MTTMVDEQTVKTKADMKHFMKKLEIADNILLCTNGTELSERTAGNLLYHLSLEINYPATIDNTITIDTPSSIGSQVDINWQIWDREGR